MTVSITRVSLHGDVPVDRPPSATVVPAAKVRDALLQTGGTVYRLDHAIVLGPLDLRHRTVERPVQIRDCVFTDEVDLRYAEFEGAVELASCEFLGRFNSGDPSRSCTIYRKDLLCIGSTFYGLASFNGAHVEGSASFEGSTFPVPAALSRPADGASETDDVIADADFTGMRIASDFICSQVTFDRSVSFNGLQCDSGMFHGTRFLEGAEEVDFRAAIFRGNIELKDPQVDHAGDSERLRDVPGSDAGQRPCGARSTTSHRDRAETWPVVHGRLNLNGFRCERKAIFRGAVFHGEVDCTDAVFGWNLDASGARFHDRAIFTAVTCKGAAIFRDAAFTHRTHANDSAAVDFRYAAFDALELSRATFHGTVNLGQVCIEEKLRLDETRFHARVFLYGARMGSLVLLNDGYSIRAAPLLADVCSPEPDMARLRSTEGRDAVHRALTSELHRRMQDHGIHGGAADPVAVCTCLDDVLRGDRQLLERVVDYYIPFQFEGDARPAQPRWWQRVNMGFWQLWPMATREPEPRPRGLELRGCTFDRIQAGSIPVLSDALIRAFLASQTLRQFSRDPYLQLEQCYRRTGDEEKANQVHVWGHLAMRHNALSTGGAVRWSRLRRVWDSILMYTGWGHQTSRIGLACLLVLLAGLLYFAAIDGALKPKDPPGASASLVTNAGSVTLALAPPAAGGEPACGRDQSCWFERGEYTVNAFLPAVSLGTRDPLTPASDQSEAVRLVLVIAGWVLLPLWAGSFAAVARRE